VGQSTHPELEGQEVLVVVELLQIQKLLEHLELQILEGVEQHQKHLLVLLVVPVSFSSHILHK
jgi:hypothetical protein